MHPFVYDVTVFVDGFISGPNGDISNFAHSGRIFCRNLGTKHL